MTQQRRLVVVGNGMAGVRAIEDIIACGGEDQFEITLFGDENYGNYNRILLSNVLSGVDDIDDIYLNPKSWYSKRGITLYAGQRVIDIDRAAKKVMSDQGIIADYDILLVATGSRAFIPPIKGILDDRGQMKTGVYAFRNINDCIGIMEAAKTSRKAIVIGGGLLGLEAAYGLLTHDCEVQLVHRGKRLMDRQLDDPAAAILRSTMEKLGVSVHLAKNSSEVKHENGKVSGLRFADGDELDADLIVVATGIQPNAEIGLRAGITVERAIVVDDQMRSPDDPNIFAVGECVQHRGQVYGLVAPIWEQTQVFAEFITGKNPKAAYHGSKIATKLKVMGIDLASMGVIDAGEADDEIVQFSEPKRGTYKKLIIRNGRLIGAIMMGDLDKLAFLMQAFDRNTPLPEERLSLLFNLGAPEKELSLSEMPAEMQVCNCNGVTAGKIADAVQSGCRSAKAVMDATRGGMGCGSCKGLINDLVDFYCDGAAEVDPAVHYYVPAIPLKKPELTQVIQEKSLKSVSSVFKEFTDGKEDPESKPALASLLNIIWSEEYDDERDARFINDRVHGNIQKDGTFSVIPEMPGGLTTADELRRIADAADKYQVPTIKLTGGQRIDLLGISKENLPGIWKDLAMPAGWAWSKSYRTCKSCVGTDYCRFGLGDSMGLAQKIEAKFRGLESPGKLKLATTGCPRNCAEAYVKDVGAVAIGEDQWEIYVGGAAGSHIRKGDLLCTVTGEAAVLTISGRFIQFYREQAKYKERTHTFIERLGIDEIRAVVVDDRDGIALRLDDSLEGAVVAAEATRDPWQEAEQPKTANQFVELIAHAGPYEE